MMVILTALMTWLYPWNLEAGAFATRGWTNNDLGYRAEKVYLGLDRWRKDYAVLRVHQFRLDDFYREQGANLSLFRWWRDELKTGVDAGLVTDDSDAWFLGGRVEGAFPRFGYALSWHELRSGGDGFYPLLHSIDGSSTVQLRLRRLMGPFLLEPGVQVSRVAGEAGWMGLLRVSGWISGRVYVSAGHAFGRSRFPVNPNTLNVDLANQRTVARYHAGVSVRLSPHLYAHGSLERTSYEAVYGDEWDARVTYLTVGLNIRY